MVQNRLSLVAAVVLVLATVVGGVALATTDAPADQAPSTAQPTDNATIQVSASGSIASNPDKAVIHLAVEASAENASVARQRVAENVSAMRTALQEMGLNESQLRTTDFNLYKDERERRAREKEGESEETVSVVYRAEHQLAIELDDVDRAGAVIDTAIANGATNLHDIQFTLSAETRRTLREKALKQAMKNARSKADTLASSANLTVSGVDIVTTVNNGDREFAKATPAPQAAAGGDSTSINSGPVTVSVSVTVEYEAVSSEQP